jgi:predicted metal-dependent peptidase
MKLKKIEVADRVIQAKIKIINGNPYFAEVTLYVTIEEDIHKILDPWAGMCITQDDMIYYNPEFVKSLKDDELIFCILHEVMHRVFLHIERGYGKPNLKWNIAIDLVVNTLLKNNGYKPPHGVILPDSNDNFIISGKNIKNISSKTAEEIYDELPNIPEPP